MKSKIYTAIIAVIVCVAISFAQNKPDHKKSDLQTTKSIQQNDSFYYGCVPCCQPCSIYKTDKPGECPHCGMTLEKRSYLAEVNETENAISTNNTCKKPTKKGHGK